MAATSPPISDMLVTVKARQIQRAMLAEMHGDRDGARRHFLAAAHLELVLAHDYEEAGNAVLAFRSRLSSASCLWRGGEIEQGRHALETLQAQQPAQAATIQQILAELSQSDVATTKSKKGKEIIPRSKTRSRRSNTGN
jgi:hypothetical protein